MQWDRFFQDLEDQLDSEWEAERAALDTEAQRLRLSRVALGDRLSVLADAARALSVELSDGTVARATVSGVGADFVALLPTEGRQAAMMVPFAAIAGIGMPETDLLRSVRPAPARSALAQRVTFGYVLRDLARRRAGVAVHLALGRALNGTIDRAGADHLDLAIHDPGEPRRAEAVVAYRVIPFAAISWVRSDGMTSVL